ncbi:universal stress protein [Mucilaginibacter sp.]|jgi:nucleotide-binding universal stress UspA family protein|uniref:universal stress protein n=1 Tax=Mucilaginibacter sp. TaxID=1882438 RepID=UPI003564B459
MKTILVPTDFSSASKNAARYAMHLAKKIKANLLLCNAILIPAEAPMAGQVVWPLEDYDSLKASADHELNALADRLKLREEEATVPENFHPAVNINTEIGQVTDVIRNVFAGSKANITVMGMSGAGNVSGFFWGSNTQELIETATFPLILIPSDFIFKGITKIAFATDLSEGDIEVIHSIASFAKYFNAEILVVHVTDGTYDENASQKKVENFLCQVSNKANYPRIYYRHVLNTSINDGLDWLTEHGQVDMMVMIHRNHSVWHRIFKGSHTQQMARNLNIPLMVYPADCHPMI